MSQKITFKLILKSRAFEVPFQFKNISDVSTNIFEQIILDQKHEYYVTSDVNEEILQSFINFWVQGTEPNVNIENYYQYFLLSEEFNLMKDYLTSIKSNWTEYDQNLYNLSDPNISDKSILEQKVAQDLDYYIENYSDRLFKLSIQSLYNIFSYKEKKFTKHDRAYELICHRYIESNDRNIFVLLKFIEGQNIEYTQFKDSILNSEERFGYMAKFDISFFEDINMVKEQNHKQSEVIEELKKNCEEQKKEIEKLTNDIELLNRTFSSYKENAESEKVNLKSLIDEINSQNKMLIDSQNKKIKENEVSISKMETEIENLKKMQSDMNSQIKQKHISMDPTLDDLSTIECPNGFFKYLFDECKDNPINRGLIDITGNWCNDNEKSLLPNIIDSNFNSTHYASKNEQNSYIKISFKKYLVKIDKYMIKSGNTSNVYHLKSWVIKGIDKKGQEIILDDVNNATAVTITRNIQNNQFVNSICLQMKEKNSNNGYYMCLRNIELFGVIKIQP